MEITCSFYFIDLLDAVIRSARDPTLEGKLYHTFEASHDEEGKRIFDKANCGLVMETLWSFMHDCTFLML